MVEHKIHSCICIFPTNAGGSCKKRVEILGPHVQLLLNLLQFCIKFALLFKTVCEFVFESQKTCYWEITFNSRSGHSGELHPHEPKAHAERVFTLKKHCLNFQDQMQVWEKITWCSLREIALKNFLMGNNLSTLLFITDLSFSLLSWGSLVCLISCSLVNWCLRRIIPSYDGHIKIGASGPKN